MSRKSFGLIQEGGVDIPKLKHWVLTPKLDKEQAAAAMSDKVIERNSQKKRSRKNCRLL